MVSSHTIKLKRVLILEMKVITILKRIITKTNKTIKILTFLNTTTFLVGTSYLSVNAAVTVRGSGLSVNFLTSKNGGIVELNSRFLYVQRV